MQSDVTDTPGQPDGIGVPAGHSTGPQEPFSSRWSMMVTGLSALILLAALGLIVVVSTIAPKLDRFDEPDRAVELMVSRMMEAQEGLHHMPGWQQWLLEWSGGSPETERTQAIAWYRELAAGTGQPLSRLRLAILQGESGHAEEALAEAAAWRDMEAPLSEYAAVMEAAYGREPIPRTYEIDLQSRLAEALPAGWFYYALAGRLAERAGDAALSATIEAERTRRGLAAQRWSTPLLAMELTALILGSVMLIGIVRLKRQRMDILRLHEPGVPPPWSGAVGAAVLLRGGAVGALLSLAFLSLAPAENVSLRALAIPMSNLPLLGLTYAYLLKPAGLTFREGFGLRVPPSHAGRLAGVVLAVVAAGLWGEWAMGHVSEWLTWENHWTEWFDPDLVWASPSVLAISLLEYVVLAPIFEELAFRGLLFATLRRRLSFLPAALASAVIFAAAHGYGLIGFISVLWSGLLWAWIYERTGSLIPGMLAHAANNLMVCLAVMALLR